MPQRCLQLITSKTKLIFWGYLFLSVSHLNAQHQHSLITENWALFFLLILTLHLTILSKNLLNTAVLFLLFLLPMP